MKKSLVVLGILAALAAPQVAGAEGFAINEWSTEGVAMGGARLFAEDDPANIAYNPASLTKVKGKAMKLTATYMSPHGHYKADIKDAYKGLYGGQDTVTGRNKIHAAWAPGTYYVQQMDDKNWWGLGAFSRFAMVSEFERHSPAGSNAFFSKLNGLSVTPVYAHKFDKKWSAAVGGEINYVGLELQNNLMGQVATQTKGDSYALGWNAAANYAFDDKNEIGLVYRSKITHSLEADFDAYLPSTYAAMFGTDHIRRNAYGKVTLPDSYAIGYNHKFDKKTRVELNATRTQWHTYDSLNISFDQPVLGMSSKDAEKRYKDGWRYAIGIEHKLSDKYTIMAGYAYDEAGIPNYDSNKSTSGFNGGGDFIIPTGERRTYSIGARYNDKKQAVAVAFGYMDIGGLKIPGHSTDTYKSATTHDNSTKVFSIGYERHF